MTGDNLYDYKAQESGYVCFYEDFYVTFLGALHSSYPVGKGSPQRCGTHARMGSTHARMGTTHARMGSTHARMGSTHARMGTLQSPCAHG